MSLEPAPGSSLTSSTSLVLRQLVICVGNDKKVVFKDPTKTLQSVVDKICYDRNLDVNQLQPYDQEIPLSYQTKLSEINGGFVFLKKKEYSEIDLNSTNIKDKDPVQYVTLLQDYLSEKESEIYHLLEQITILEKKIKSSNSNSSNNRKSRQMKARSKREEGEFIGGGGGGNGEGDASTTPGIILSAEHSNPGQVQNARLSKVNATTLGVKSSSEREKRLSLPLADQQQIFRLHDENERLMKKLNRINMDKKPEIMDCFSNTEVTSLLQNEIVSRLLICNGSGVKADANDVHPDVVKLRDFLKKGRYLEKTDYLFPSILVKTFMKAYKSNNNSIDALCFWLAQLVFILDWVHYVFPVGRKISYNGVDFSKTKANLLTASTAESFWEELHQIILKILNRLFKSIQLKPLCLKLLTDKDKENKGTLSTIIKTFNTLLHAFNSHSVCPSIILQFFHTLYRHLDLFMFNQLLNLPSYTPLTAVTIKINLAEFECWKYQQLKKIYPISEKDHVFVPFVDVAVMVYMSQATGLFLFDKALLLDEKVIQKEFGQLSRGQLAVLLGKFVPDVYSPDNVPPTVLDGLVQEDKSLTKVRVDENTFYSIVEMK